MKKAYQLNLPKLDNKYWHDKDELMIQAAFQLLVDFIEKEKPVKYVDWNADPDHKKAWKEMNLLYKWWKQERPVREKKYSKVKVPKMKTVKGKDNTVTRVPVSAAEYKKFVVIAKKWTDDENKWHEDDQNNLHRLIEVRPFMWI